MIRKTLGIIVGSVLALAFMAFVPAARADESDELSQLTFNQPVEIPGNHVLPAGTYWFVVANATNGGNVVQIFNADRTQLFATLEANATERPNITKDTQLTFANLSPNRPITLISWFYPDQTEGHRFVYSSEQESQMIGASRTTVMARNAP